MELEIKIPKQFLKIKASEKLGINELTNILFIQKGYIFNTNSIAVHLYRIENDIQGLDCIALDLTDLKFLLKNHNKRLLKDFITLIINYENKNHARAWIKGFENTTIEVDLEKQAPNVEKVFTNESLKKLKPMTKDFLHIRDFKSDIIPNVLIKDNSLKLRLGEYVLLEKEYIIDETAKREFGIRPNTFCLLFENKDFEFHYELDKIFCKQGDNLFACCIYFL